MYTKKIRQERILEIVRRRPVSSQERLSSLLAASGIRVTQATLSRDMRELELVKIRGSYHTSGVADGPPDPEGLRRGLKQLVLESAISGNILMVRTAPGSGHALGVVLDSARWPEILGTVAGDDTVFALLKNGRLGKKVIRRIEECVS